jgi:hypothetical protein
MTEPELEFDGLLVITGEIEVIKAADIRQQDEKEESWLSADTQ